MKQFKILGVAMATALLVAACGGGGGDGNQAPAVSFTSVVSFGDSLSDAGTYNVGTIKTAGGGMFTVNGITGAIGADPTPSYNWAQLVSAAAIGKISCAARTGGFGVAETTVAGCTNYAQGGARVTDPKGANNTVGAGNIAGPLTEPVLTQIANYAADGGTFTGKELVTVLAGANDLSSATTQLAAAATAAGTSAFVQSLVAQLASGATSPQTAAAAILGAIVALPAGTSTTVLVGTAVGTAAVQTGNSAVASPAVYGPMVATAQAAGSAAGNTYASTTGTVTAMTSMATAATALANSVKGLITSGAKYVVVSNIPDVSQTPKTRATIVYNADGTVKDNSSQQLVLALTTQFNTTLQTALAGTPGVVFVDAFAENQRQIANPAHYALSNVKDTACNLTLPGNILATSTTVTNGSSLVCNTTNLIAGDTSHYLFADDLHPTPYGHKLLAQYAIKALVIAGWI